MHSITHDSSLPMRTHWVVYDERCMHPYLLSSNITTPRFRSENKSAFFSLSISLCFLSLNAQFEIWFNLKALFHNWPRMYRLFCAFCCIISPYLSLSISLLLSALPLAASPSACDCDCVYMSVCLCCVAYEWWLKLWQKYTWYDPQHIQKHNRYNWEIDWARCYGKCVEAVGTWGIAQRCHIAHCRYWGSFFTLIDVNCW